MAEGIKLPNYLIPNPPIIGPTELPRPSLDAPSGEIPTYLPMYVGPGQLEPPEGVTSEEEDANANKPVSKDLKKIDIPWTDYQLTVPREEILGAASISAVVSVTTTLVATSVLKQATKIVKPLVQQIITRIKKKFTNGDTNREAEESSG